MTTHKFSAIFIFIVALFIGFTGPHSVKASGFTTNRNSYNWSGYIMANDSYSGVEGSWIVPISTPANSISSNAEWVGIGGQKTPDLIQAGTIATYINNRLTYQAWVEILPDNAQALPLGINPGDSVTVSIHESTPNVWTVIFKNNSSGAEAAKDISYVSSHSSAEWIEETPLIEGSNATLSNFNSVSFMNGRATTANGTAENLANGGAEPIYMIDQANQATVAEPSPIDASGSGFTVSRINAPIYNIQYTQPIPAPEPIQTPIQTPIEIAVIRFSSTTGLPVLVSSIGQPTTVTTVPHVVKKVIKKKVTVKKKKKIAVKKKVILR